MHNLAQDNMFELKNVKAARLWMLPSAVKEVAIKLLWEDKLAHPQWPHVFVVPRFMTELWRRDLGRSADILFTVPAGVPFGGASQFEPLIVAIIFPLSHVSSYTGPRSVKGTKLGEHFQQALQEGFKRPGAGTPTNGSRGAEVGSGGLKSPPGTSRGSARDELGLSTVVPGDPRQLHVMEGPLLGVFSDPEGGSRALLWELLAGAGELPPVRECLVRRVLQGVTNTKRQLPQAGPPTKWVRPGR